MNKNLNARLERLESLMPEKFRVLNIRIAHEGDCPEVSCTCKTNGELFQITY